MDHQPFGSGRQLGVGFAEFRRSSGAAAGVILRFSLVEHIRAATRLGPPTPGEMTDCSIMETVGCFGSPASKHMSQGGNYGWGYT